MGNRTPIALPWLMPFPGRSSSDSKYRAVPEIQYIWAKWRRQPFVVASPARLGSRVDLIEPGVHGSSDPPTTAFLRDSTSGNLGPILAQAEQRCCRRVAPVSPPPLLNPFPRTFFAVFAHAKQSHHCGRVSRRVALHVFRRPDTQATLEGGVSAVGGCSPLR